MVTKFSEFLKENTDTDIVAFDVPLFIRLLELSREDIKDDAEIHTITEKITEICKTKKFLTMKDYDAIIASLRQQKQ